MRPFRFLSLMVIAVTLPACAASSDALRPKPGTATMVLVDVSKSTRNKEIRQRYIANFEFTLREIDAIGDEGSELGVDVIDDNPLAHGRLPVRQTFTPCGPLENSRRCEQARSESRNRAASIVRDLTQETSTGTDLVGALFLAEDFFSAHKEILPQQLVILSDMVQSSGPLKSQEVIRWSPRRIVESLNDADLPDLKGIEVYVVGAGATAPGNLGPAEIRAMEAFWAKYFRVAGADLTFYGPTLPDFPL